MAFCNGSAYNLIWNSGLYDAEISFEITAPDGSTLLTVADASSLVDGASILSLTAACPTDAVDWQNLQSPGSGTLESGETYTVYARVFEPGVTDSPGEGTAVDAWIGYSTSNTNPMAWTNWVPATYFGDDGINNDEYTANLGSVITAAGTYYYASRFQINGGPYRYGGYEATDSDGNGTWDGTADISGVLTVTAPVADWYNLQWPAGGTINYGDTFNVYAQAYEADGVTAAPGQATGLQCWIGYNTTDTDPSTWSNWAMATFNSQQRDNDEFIQNLGGSIPTPGTYYYASRFRYNNGAYTYGGYDGGAWNGTSNVSGLLTVNAFPGDLCSAPIALTVGNTFDENDMVSTLLNMSGSTETPNPSCAGYSSGDKDVWFSVVVPASGTITVETRRVSGSTLTDTGMQVYSGTCGTLTAVECDDDDSPDGNFSMVSLTGRTPGETLLVRVWDYSNSHFDSFNISAYTCVSGTTTWDGAAWDNGAPTSGHATVINGNYTMPATQSSCNCTVNNGFTLTIPANMTYTVYNNIVNNGNIDVLHEGSFLQIDDFATFTGSGTYKVNKTTAAYRNYDYIYWSSPLNNETIASVFAENNQSYIYRFVTANYSDMNSGAYPQGTPGDDGFDDNGDDWATASGTMTAGKGYIVLGKGSPIPFNASQVANMQPAQSVVFDGGRFNNGTINIAVSRDKYHIDASSGYDDANLNLNLIGNPYPSAIDINKLKLGNNALLTGSFYFWTHDLGVTNAGGPNAYDYYNSSFATAVTDGTSFVSTASGTGVHAPQYISSGQGFMAAVSIDGSVSFNNSMRVASHNNTFLKHTGMADRIWLNMTNSDGLFRQIAVGFRENSSDAYVSGEDAPRMTHGDNTDFYSIIADDDRTFAIQTQSEFQIDKTVPLGVSFLQAGTYQITIDHLQGVFTEGQNIYVEDTYLNIIHNFITGPYTFNTAVGADIDDRFILRFTNSLLSNPEEMLNNLVIYPNPSTGIFNFYYNADEALKIEVYDITGKRITNFKTQQSGANYSIDLTQNASGVYFAKITSDGNQTTKKLMVE